MSINTNQESKKLLLDINPQDHLLGTKTAPLILIEYGDYQCNHCQSANEYLPKLFKKYKDKLTLVFRHFPMQTQHEFSFLAAEAAEASGFQGKFWQMHDLIFKNQIKLDRTIFYDFAKSLKLDLEVFEEQLLNHFHSDKINQDFKSGIKSGVNGTPTFFFNGTRYNGVKNFNELDQSIEAILNSLN